jgi:hypothetical protein
MRPTRLAALLALAACRATAPAPAPNESGGPAAATAPAVSEASVRRALGVLAADSLEGRATGARGSAKAAAFIAAEMRDAGLEPAGDSGYFQRVPLALGTRRGGRTGPVLLPALADRDTVGAARRLQGVNVVGVLAGRDAALRDEVVLVDAHYDHLGIGPAVKGDSIYNGADDDASGTVAVLEIARALARGPRPRRTVVFLATTGEEVGLLGTRWYIDHPVRPLDRTVANLEIEMIGRPDSLAGGAGRAWLTGFERSTMGARLARASVPLVADPRPAENFFERSDNIAFARLGIPAHTLSSFDLHGDYHHPSDDVSRVDFAHMTAVITSAVRAVRILADDETRVEWNPNGRPAAR